jgi:hypothetical protein
MKRATSSVLVLALAGAASCIVEPEPMAGIQTFKVDVVRVNDVDPPKRSAPLSANTGKTNEKLSIEIVAVGTKGERVDFDKHVRISVEPGAVVGVIDSKGNNTARNLKLRNGKASADVLVTAVYGETRIIVEDLGYKPSDPGDTPECANGENDDTDLDVFVDFPTDTGCAFPDDDSEEPGTHAAGASEPIHFSLPTLREVQGASETPFPFEGLQVKADSPQLLVVTRIAKDGFYVTDLADQGRGSNHMFAFSFSTPPGLRVCDRVTYLAGTLAEFFGFTEMNFPSYEADPLFEGQEEKCLVPEPRLLDSADPEMTDRPIANEQAMEGEESGLVRVKDFVVAGKFGPKESIDNEFGPEQSNCDLNGDGRVDFLSEAEASCSNVCNADPDCTEWTQFAARGSYKIHRGTTMIMVQTDGAPEFSPTSNRGTTLTSVTGTLRNFSGGSLNWTIEARCPDDLVCDADGCASEIKPPNEACVSLRPTEEDNDEGTN